MASIRPPFDQGDELTASISPSAGTAVHASQLLPLALPSAFVVRKDSLRTLQAVSQSLDSFFGHELDVSRLNQLHKHLWLAGLPQPPRCLHEHIGIGRSICITERADLHMLWAGKTIYLKPLPSFLLCHDIWESHLVNIPGLHAAALGFLRSYVWLIIYPSDFRIAVDHGLIDGSISWSSWSSFVSKVIQNGILHTVDVNPRYRFGELRLHRVHWLYRLCSRGAKTRGEILRGYHYTYQSYSSFIEENLAWLLTVFLYVAIVLTAMQVGLATDRLKDSRTFQQASWGFTVVALIAPLGIVFAVVLFTMVLVLNNLLFTQARRGRTTTNDTVWQNVAMKGYQH